MSLSLSPQLLAEPWFPVGAGGCPKSSSHLWFNQNQGISVAGSTDPAKANMGTHSWGVVAWVGCATLKNSNPVSQKGVNRGLN